MVNYRPQGNRPTEFPGPLGPPISVGVCAICQAIDQTQPPAASCPVCGATPQQNPGYRVTALSQPTGFRTWYGRSRDFDGTFEWTPRASRPKMGIGQLPFSQRANFEVWADQETVYVINDNDGRLFDFEKLVQGETWVTRLALANVGVNNPQIDSGAGIDQRALLPVFVDLRLATRASGFERRSTPSASWRAERHPIASTYTNAKSRSASVC